MTTIDVAPRIFMPRPKKAKLYSFALLIEGKNPLVIPFSAINQIALEQQGADTIKIQYMVRERAQEIHFAVSHFFGTNRNGTLALYQQLQSTFSRYLAAHRQATSTGPGRRTLLADLALGQQAGTEIDLFLADLAQVEPEKGKNYFPFSNDLPFWGVLLALIAGISPLFVSSADRFGNLSLILLGMMYFFVKDPSLYIFFATGLGWAAIGDMMTGGQGTTFGLFQAAIAGLALLRYRAVISTPKPQSAPKNILVRLLATASAAVGLLTILGFIFAVALAVIFPELVRQIDAGKAETLLASSIRLIADIAVIAFSWAAAAFARNSRWNLTLACGLAFNGTVIVLFLVLVHLHSGI